MRYRIVPTFGLVACAILGGSIRGLAQAPMRAGLRDMQPTTPAAFSAPTRGSVPRSKWQTGMLVGAGVGVLVSGFVYELAKHTSDTEGSFNPVGAILIIGVCSLLGGLIGSGFRSD